MVASRRTKWYSIGADPPFLVIFVMKDSTEGNNVKAPMATIPITRLHPLPLSEQQKERSAIALRTPALLQIRAPQRLYRCKSRYGRAS